MGSLSSKSAPEIHQYFIQRYLSEAVATEIICDDLVQLIKVYLGSHFFRFDLVSTGYKALLKNNGAIFNPMKFEANAAYSKPMPLNTGTYFYCIEILSLKKLFAYGITSNLENVKTKKMFSDFIGNNYYANSGRPEYGTSGTAWDTSCRYRLSDYKCWKKGDKITLAFDSNLGLLAFFRNEQQITRSIQVNMTPGCEYYVVISSMRNNQFGTYFKCLHSDQQPTFGLRSNSLMLEE